MNYNDLQSNIAAWFARTDLPTATFIALAEEEMNRTLRLQGMEDMASATPQNQTDNNLWYITYPADMLELKHIETDGVRMDYVSNHQQVIDTNYRYTLANELLLFGNSSPVDIYYYAKVPALSAQNLTNLFTETGYDALLYLALAHAASYMQQPNDFRQVAVERMTEIATMNSKAQMAGSTLVQRA